MNVMILTKCWFTPVNSIERLSIYFFLSIALLAGLPMKATAYQQYSKVQDLGYGRVLFDYHQGNFLDALTTINIVEKQGGISGHGEHPKLLEGGLLLSYGMVESAKQVFETLLNGDDSSGLRMSDRNLAWFYMGKVFYLQGQFDSAISSFEKIDLTSFKKNKSELYQEYLYLYSLIAQSGIEISRYQSLKSDVSDSSIWAQYSLYNVAARASAIDKVNTSGESSEKSRYLEAIGIFNKLVKKLESQVAPYFEVLLSNVKLDLEGSPELALANERLALLEQSYLSIAQLYLRDGNSELAMSFLRKIRKHGLLSDQAYFTFAIASSELGHYAYALEALSQLKERELFTPWLQQVPYAMAFLYEKMGEAGLALESFKLAVVHHERLDQRLSQQIEGLTESKIIDTFKLEGLLGSSSISNDQYGRIKVAPQQFDYAYLLADERFQKQLSDLHELYKIKGNLSLWHSKLDSFDHMMMVRTERRNAKIESINQEFEQQQANLWKAQAAAWRTKVNNAIELEDGFFFLRDEQQQYKKRIASVLKNLADLPDSHPLKPEFIERIRRVESYFNWLVVDQLSINQWAELKQLRLLEGELEDFDDHQKMLYQEMASNDVHLKFQERINDAQADLVIIQESLESSLNLVRNSMLQMVREELKRQRVENLAYLRESRKSLARLADEFYRGLGTQADERASEDEEVIK